MDEFIQKIQDERAKLERKIEECQKKVMALIECEEIFKEKGGDSTRLTSAPSKPLRIARTPAPPQRTKEIKHADIAEKILRERGPLKPEAIARLFEDEGRKTTTNSLRTILSREKGKRFERNKRGEWLVKKGTRKG